MFPAPVGVLHVIAPAPYGGAETVLLALGRGMRDRLRFSLAILADARSGPFIERVQAAGLAHTILDSPGRNYLRDIREIRALVRRDQIAVLHSHGYRADAVGLVAARLGSIPNVATAHGFTGGTARNRMNQFAGVQALRHSSAVVAVSSALRGTLQDAGVRANRIHVIPNAWAPPAGRLASRAEARARLGLPANGQVIGWVGRLSPEKGPDLAVEALAGLGGDAWLCMVGDGPEREAVQRQARGAGVAARLRTAGSLAAAWEILPAFDVLLLSSRTEGTPMVLLEAMHAGVPIVAAAVGGVPALLDEETAILVQPSAPAIRDALHAVLGDPCGAARRAVAAQDQLARRNDIDDWVDRHVTLYSLLSGVPAA